MTRDTFEEVREREELVLQSVANGATNTTSIRQETTLSNNDVNYSFDKLENLGLLRTHSPEGRVTRVIDGQKRNFKAPRRVRLTEKGREYLEYCDTEPDQYAKMSHDELVQRQKDLEKKVDQLEEALEAFRKQMRREL